MLWCVKNCNWMIRNEPWRGRNTESWSISLTQSCRSFLPYMWITGKCFLEHVKFDKTTTTITTKLKTKNWYLYWIHQWIHCQKRTRVFKMFHVRMYTPMTLPWFTNHQWFLTRPWSNKTFIHTQKYIHIYSIYLIAKLLYSAFHNRQENHVLRLSHNIESKYWMITCPEASRHIMYSKAESANRILG